MARYTALLPFILSTINVVLAETEEFGISKEISASGHRSLMNTSAIWVTTVGAAISLTLGIYLLVVYLTKNSCLGETGKVQCLHAVGSGNPTCTRANYFVVWLYASLTRLPYCDQSNPITCDTGNPSLPDNAVGIMPDTWTEGSTQPIACDVGYEGTIVLACKNPGGEFTVSGTCEKKSKHEEGEEGEEGEEEPLKKKRRSNSNSNPN